MVQNLLKNASEAVPASSGQIIIETAYKQGIRLNIGNHIKENLPLQFSIIDNGNGVPDQLKEDIFDPFVTSKIGGTGLGLALVSKVVEEHGAIIEFESILRDKEV